jgi:hypothetical protein
VLLQLGLERCGGRIGQELRIDRLGRRLQRVEDDSAA